MTIEDNAGSVWSRPGFIAAAVVVGLLVVAGIVLAVITAVGGNENAAPSPTVTASPSPDTNASDESVCGIGDIELTGTLAAAPEVEWAYQGTTGYPVSTSAGPGVTSDTGVRSCFEHTPTGALLMAANAVSQGSDMGTGTEWAQYALAEGPYRVDLVEQIGTPSSSAGTRLDIAGFRVLAYDGGTARIDLAITGSSDGTPVTLSAVYELVWQDGDWKISADTPTPLNLATIPNVAGYISWGA